MIDILRQMIDILRQIASVFGCAVFRGVVFVCFDKILHNSDVVFTLL